MRRLTVHESTQVAVTASTSTIWLAHAFAPDLEWIASIAVAIIAALATDVEHLIWRWRLAERDLEGEL